MSGLTGSARAFPSEATKPANIQRFMIPSCRFHGTEAASIARHGQPNPSLLAEQHESVSSQGHGHYRKRDLDPRPRRSAVHLSRDPIDCIVKGLLFVPIGTDPDGHQAVLEGLVPLFGLAAEVSVGIPRNITDNCGADMLIHARFSARPRRRQVMLVPLCDEARQIPGVVGNKFIGVERKQSIKQVLFQSS